VKLLLDEMYPPALALGLRRLGHDANGVQADEGLRASTDEALFDIAQQMGRAIVTENAKDFLPLAALAQGGGVAHHGLILTHNSSFPRHRGRFIGALTAALAGYLDGPFVPAGPVGLVHWLVPAVGG
jgi:predicted nuclease of predicted toxin-antitoxin system